MENLHNLVNWLNAPLWDTLVIVLVLVGIFFTVSTGFVQIRLFARSFVEMKRGRKSTSEHGITPFQAFSIGLASRVGVGNIAGVAIAISLGGPGAVFWMWITAFLGMSSAFAESTLAQLFKIEDTRNKHFRGGPAYYIEKGLKQKWLAIIFALSLILTYGFIFNSVQANTIIHSGNRAWAWNAFDFEFIGIPISIVGLGLVILTSLSIFGGIRRISRVSEILVPIMAVFYLIMAIYIVITHLPMVPDIFSLIFTEAFNFKSAAGGFFGGMISQAMMLGIKRGLFSNEAGMGSAPNAAAASDVPHPVNQGLIQMIGVFIDTFVVCSCTAVIILISGAYTSGINEGAQLTQAALETFVGSWGADFLAIVIFLFAFSSIIGNYAYAESNVQYINNNPKIMMIFRLLVLFMVYFGAVNSVPLVWDMADLSMGFMAMINLIAIVLLSPIVFLLLKDFSNQLKAGKYEPEFNINQHPKLKKRIDTDIWDK